MPTITHSSTTTYQDFLSLLTNYLRTNDTLLKRDLPSLLPGLSESQIKAFTKQAVAEGRITQRQGGYQGPWVIRLTATADAPAQTDRPSRRNLEKEIPPKLFRYLRSHGTITLGQFRREFGVTNAVRARTLLTKLTESGKLRTEEDPATGKTVYVLASSPVQPRTETAVSTESPVRRTRSKSKKYYQLQAQLPQLLRERPDGLRYLELTNHFKLNRNDATLISVLKDLVASGVITREEGTDVEGRRVTYRLASYAPARPAPATPMTVSVGDERDETIAFLLARYEEILNMVEKKNTQIQQLQQLAGQVPDLQQQLATFRDAALAHQREEERQRQHAETHRPLPSNLQEKLRQMAERDESLTGTRLGNRLRSFQKGNLNEVGR